MDYRELQKRVGDEKDNKHMRAYVEEIIGCQIEDGIYREVEENSIAKIQLMERSGHITDFAYRVLLMVDMVKQVMFSRYTILKLKERRFECAEM